MIHRQLLCGFIAGALTWAIISSIFHSSHTSWPNHLNAITGRSDLQHQVPSTPSRVTSPFTAFPQTIWQTASAASIVKYANHTASWHRLNPSHSHKVLTDADADAFVSNTFQHQPSLIHFWQTLPTPVVRADLLRYLLLLTHGGVYSDIDTTCYVPIAEWVPPAYRARANVVVGIEYDDTILTKVFVRPISFSQWTLLAKPGHPIFLKAVERVRSNLEFAARQRRTTLDKLELGMVETLEATGPGMITDVVLEVIRDQVALEEGRGRGSKVIGWESFHGLEKPTLFGDVLVLPINGFAGHQKHSHAGEKGYGRKLIRHHFGRSWYESRKKRPH
jgi:alpha 1,6-mannosyltransferase